MTPDDLMRWAPVFALIAFISGAAFFFLTLGLGKTFPWLLGISFAFSALGFLLVIISLIIEDFWGK